MKRTLQYYCVTENPTAPIQVSFLHYLKCKFFRHENYIVEWTMEA
jgi:hypothetical protein